MALGDAEIVSGDEVVSPEAIVVSKGLAEHFKADTVSISLKYYQKRAECWSDWGNKDLKGFTKIIELLRQQSANQLRGKGAGGTPACKDHKGAPKGTGFSRPKEISDDIPFYEIYVHEKARIHGFFVDPVFFLVWLDRGHKAFPAGK